MYKNTQDSICEKRETGVFAMENLVSCPKCGKQVRAGAKFCTGCGFRFEEKAQTEAVVVCPACGKQLRPGARFCTACGRKFTEDKPQAAPAAASAAGSVAASEESVRVCPNCGRQLRAGAKFCTGCGMKFEAPAPEAERPAARPETAQEKAEAPAGTRPESENIRSDRSVTNAEPAGTRPERAEKTFPKETDTPAAESGSFVKTQQKAAAPAEIFRQEEASDPVPEAETPAMELQQEDTGTVPEESAAAEDSFWEMERTELPKAAASEFSINVSGISDDIVNPFALGAGNVIESIIHPELKPLARKKRASFMESFRAKTPEEREAERLAAEEKLRQAQAEDAAKKEAEERAAAQEEARRRKLEEEEKLAAEAEAARIAEEERLAAEAEAARIAEEERLAAEAETVRVAEEERLAAEAEAARAAEAERLAAEAEAARIAEEERLAAEAEEARIAEEERLAAEAEAARIAEEERLAAEAEAARIAEEERLAAEAEAARIAEEERQKAEAEAARIAEQERLAAESARLAEERARIEAERAALAAERERMLAEIEETRRKAAAAAPAENGMGGSTHRKAARAQETGRRPEAEPVRNEMGTPVRLKFCPKCGAKIRVGARFCVTCGYALGARLDAAPGQGSRTEESGFTVKKKGDLRPRTPKEMGIENIDETQYAWTEEERSARDQAEQEEFRRMLAEDRAREYRQRENASGARGFRTDRVERLSRGGKRGRNEE